MRHLNNWVNTTLVKIADRGRHQWDEIYKGGNPLCDAMEIWSNIHLFFSGLMTSNVPIDLMACLYGVASKR